MNLKERVLVEWADSDGEKRTLGSLSPVNNDDPDLLFCVNHDDSLAVFVCLSMTVSIVARGRGRPRSLLLVLPLQALQPPSFTFDVLQINHVEAVAAQVHGAGLALDGNVIRAKLTLGNPGYAALLNSHQSTIIPATLTAGDMLSGIHSLSNACAFNLYMRPSDYARTGLHLLATRLQNGELNPLNWDSTFGPQDRLDWGCCELQPRPRRKAKESSAGQAKGRATVQAEGSATDLPPPYGPQHPDTLFPGPPSSPPSSRVLETVSQPDTPTHGPPIPADIPPTPRLPSSSPPARQPSPPTEPAPLPAHQAGPAAPLPTPPPQPLYPEASARISAVIGNATDIHTHLEHIITTWLTKAFFHNTAVYTHHHVRPALAAMHHHARHANIPAFCAARIESASRFFYCPIDIVGDIEHAHALPYIRDAERLLAWMFGTDGHPLADVLAWQELLELGRAARAAVMYGARLDGAGASEVARRRVLRYNQCKSACVGRLLACCEE